MQNCFAFVVRTIQVVRVWKERFDAASVLSVLKNVFKANTRVEIVYTRFKMF